MKWSSAIQQGLDVCDAMIVILTPASATSQNVEDEWQYYRDRGKIIVPVLVAPAQLHYQLSRLQYVNFYSQSYDIALTQLHAELWRKGIALRQPPNAVTMPVPRAPKQAYAAPPPAASGARPQPARKRSGGALTLGCAGLGLVGVVAVIAFFALGGMDLLTGSTSTRTPTREVTTPTIDINPTATSPVVITPEIEIASDSARLRTGPGVSYSQLDTFALRGERFAVIAQARSIENTEDWFLIQHPSAGQVWISSVAVDLQPDGVFVPPAATIPPTLTYTPAPSPTATPPAVPTEANRVISFSGLIAFSGQTYSATFNTDRYSLVEVRARSDFSASLQVTLRTSAGAEVITSANNLITAVLPFENYEVFVSDPAGGTGAVEVTIEMRAS
jgi:hypothetical protein